jgi:hypothetical protein
LDIRFSHLDGLRARHRIPQYCADQNASGSREQLAQRCSLAATISRSAELEAVLLTPAEAAKTLRSGKVALVVSATSASVSPSS